MTKKIALSGYDPVSYFSDKVVKGNQKYHSSWDGMIYNFSSLANKEKFELSPKKYTPRYNGHCAIAVSEGLLVESSPKSYLIQNNSLLLFYNDPQNDMLKIWLRDAENRQNRAESMWKNRDNLINTISQSEDEA